MMQYQQQQQDGNGRYYHQHDGYHEEEDEERYCNEQQGQPKKKKKKGLGRIIRGVFKKKRNKKDKGYYDDNENGSINSSNAEISLYSHNNDQNGQPYYEDNDEIMEETLEPLNDVNDPNHNFNMSRILEEEDDEEDDSDESESGHPRSSNGHTNRHRNVGKFPQAKANHMISKKARDLPMDRMVRDSDHSISARKTGTRTTTTNALKERFSLPPIPQEEMFVNTPNTPLSLVLLLIDPTTLRFELLQLEFEQPHEATLNDILIQIQDPFWKPLPFVGVIDRKGNAYTKPIVSATNNGTNKKSLFRGKKKSQQQEMTSPPLEDICQYRLSRQSNNDIHRDVLVGLLSTKTVEATYQLARPILNEVKVIQLLEQNGYPLKGWIQDKSTEATLTETKVLSNNLQKTKKANNWTFRIVQIIVVVAAMTLFYKYSPHVLQTCRIKLPRYMGGKKQTKIAASKQQSSWSSWNYFPSSKKNNFPSINKKTAIVKDTMTTTSVPVATSVQDRVSAYTTSVTTTTKKETEEL